MICSVLIWYKFSNWVLFCKLVLFNVLISVVETDTPIILGQAHLPDASEQVHKIHGHSDFHPV